MGINLRKPWVSLCMIFHFMRTLYNTSQEQSKFEQLTKVINWNIQLLQNRPALANISDHMQMSAYECTLNIVILY